MSRFDVVEASIAQLRTALEAGTVTSRELTQAYLDRIDAYDRNGITLNALVVMNPDALADARASDVRRASGTALGPLDGIPTPPRTAFWPKGSRPPLAPPRSKTSSRNAMPSPSNASARQGPCSSA
ncbi:glutamyl-tRNA(Gln) amidotransferase subunit A [Arthrobacter sp. Hiyo8]|nr:glutamyl-tRNA(Gln) amidotransferase subunit A [Arthrobacter sp. Hiyo8]